MTTPATFHTPAGWVDRCTLLDDTLPHQIRFLVRYGNKLHVSCTCRLVNTSHGGAPEFKPIAPFRDADAAWAAWHLYHDDNAAEVPS